MIRIKIDQIGLFTFIHRPGIPKWIKISYFWFKSVHPWWSAYIVCKFGEILSSNSVVDWGKGVHSLAGQHFSYVRLAAPLLDASGISTEFCGAISTQFCFIYSLGGDTAMPRGLHARLCHAFLVSTITMVEIFEDITRHGT